MAAGTIALTNNSTAVTGSGTAFKTDIAVNDFIVTVVGGVTYTIGIKSIESDTGLTLNTAYNGPAASGAAWSAVANQTLVGITAQVAADVAKAIRGLNLDKANWQQVYSGTGTITVKLPDGSTFTGPAWNSITTALAAKADLTNGAVSPAQGGTGKTTLASSLTAFGFTQSTGRIYIPYEGGRILIQTSTQIVSTNDFGDTNMTFPLSFASLYSFTCQSAYSEALHGVISIVDRGATGVALRCNNIDGSLAKNKTIEVMYTAIGTAGN